MVSAAKGRRRTTRRMPSNARWSRTGRLWRTGRTLRTAPAASPFVDGTFAHRRRGLTRIGADGDVSMGLAGSWATGAVLVDGDEPADLGVSHGTTSLVSSCSHSRLSASCSASRARSLRGIRSPSARPLHRRGGDLGNRSARRLAVAGVAPPHRAFPESTRTASATLQSNGTTTSPAGRKVPSLFDRVVDVGPARSPPLRRIPAITAARRPALEGESPSAAATPCPVAATSADLDRPRLAPAAAAAGPPNSRRGPGAVRSPGRRFGSGGEAGPEARGRRRRGARQPPALDRGARRGTRRGWRKRPTVEPDSRRRRRVRRVFRLSGGLRRGGARSRVSTRPRSPVGGPGTSRWRPRWEQEPGPVLRASPAMTTAKLAAGHHG